jgi:hypothetical protein
MCLLGALFTLCSHLVVGVGGNLFWLLLAFALACGASAFVARRLPAAPARPGAGDAPPPAAAERWPRVVGAVLALAAVCWFAVGDTAVGLWIGGILALGLGLLALEPVVAAQAPARELASERALLGIALGCAAYALIAHRPEGSDALFANLAVAAEGRMDLPLLASDTLHGRDDLAIPNALYRLQSYELFVGAVAWMSSIPPLYVLHFVSTGVGALLVPLAHAELFRQLTPRHWIVSVSMLVLVLILTGETERWYGNLAFLRIWQGDGLFLFVLVPLLYSYAMRYAEAPSRRGLVLLAAAQIAALGCSAHAAWVAPVVVAGGLLSGAPLSAAGATRVARGLLPSLYGVCAWFALGASPGFAGTPRALELGARLDIGIAQVLGDDATALVCLAVALGAWTCCPAGLGRRFAVLVPLVALLTWLDPWLGEWLYRNIAGREVWRALWTLPVPVLVTLVLVAPLQVSASLPRGVGLAASAALCAVFTLALPSHYGFSTRNGVALHAPGLKVPATSYQQARLLHEHAAGLRVVAPADVSTWLPTFRNPAHPLMVQPYLDASRVGNHDPLRRWGGPAYRGRCALRPGARALRGGGRLHPGIGALRGDPHHPASRGLPAAGPGLGVRNLGPKLMSFESR